MKVPVNFRLDEDIVYVMRHIAVEWRIPYSKIIASALRAELQRMIAAGKPVDLRKKYDGKVAKSAKFGR